MNFYPHFACTAASGLFVSIGTYYFINQHKRSSSIFKHSLLLLRNHPDSQEYGNLTLSEWTWIKGPVNAVKGICDAEFTIHGDKKDGLVKVKAKKHELEWELQEVSLDGKRIV